VRDVKLDKPNIFENLVFLLWKQIWS